MKIRFDYVSNSSSSSFIITNPDCISKDEKAIKLLKLAEFISLHFITDEMSDDDLKKFKEDVEKNFKDSVEIDSYYDGELNITLYTENSFRKNVNWFNKLTKNKLQLLSKMFTDCTEVCLNFGDCCENNGIATQVATLLDYLFKAKVEVEDHFDYTSISDLGIK